MTLTVVCSQTRIDTMYMRMYAGEQGLHSVRRGTHSQGGVICVQKCSVIPLYISDLGLSTVSESKQGSADPDEEGYWRMAKHTRAAVTLVSGYVADPVRQYYDYAAQATDAFDRCISSLRRERVETLLRGEERVSAVTALPPEASAVRGGWKKLHAIANASSAAASHPDALVVWHDADAVPDVESGLVERVRRIAALQPGVAVWLQPGASLARSVPPRALHAFEGVSLADVFAGTALRRRARRGPAAKATGNALQTGVLVARASRAALLSDALKYYDATAEAEGRLVRFIASRGVPQEFRCGGRHTVRSRAA